MPHRISEEQSRIFTFTRSGWIMRVIASDVCLAVVPAVLIWFKLVIPALPSQAFLRYSLTILGLPGLYIFFEFVLGALVGGPMCGWMKRHDERGLPKSTGGGGGKQVTDRYSTASDVEAAYERKRA